MSGCLLVKWSLAVANEMHQMESLLTNLDWFLTKLVWGKLARRASWQIVPCGPGQTCPFSAKHAWAPTEQRPGWGNWNPLTIITSRHVDMVVPHNRNKFQKLWEAPKGRWPTNLDPWFVLFRIWNSCEPVGWGWWRSDIATPGHSWQCDRAEARKLHLWWLRWLIDTILHQLGWLRLKHCNASHIYDIKWCKTLPIFT